jgi:hypothetical protein
VRTIRGGKGIGDALYVQAVARHLVQKERLRVATCWPDVFLPLGDRVECVPFTKAGIDILAHYSRRKNRPGTDQFVDVCLEAGIKEAIPLVLDWQINDRDLTAGLLAHRKPIVLVQLPRAPMGRTDGFGMELLPDCRAIQRAIDRLHGKALLVQVGAGTPLHRFRGIDIDLAGKTSVRQLIDVAAVSNGMLGYVSFLLPLAESLGKRALLVWSRRGLKAGHVYLRQITPTKVIHRKDLVRAVLDGPGDDVEGAADAFLRQV